MDLLEALALRPNAIVAAVGGGGKTSLVYALAREASARGLSALVCGTTKFTRPMGAEMPPVVEAGPDQIVSLVAARLREGEALVASAGAGARGRLLGFEPLVVCQLAQLGPGLLAVEADGSAHRPFKAPAEHEPVIPACSTHVVVCVGLEVLGKPLDQAAVHRPEIVARLSEAQPGEPVTPSTILRVLLHPEGGRRGVPPGAHLSALLNSPATGEHVRLGVHIAQRLVYGGFERVVVANAHRPGDVRAVVA